ncbi:hypothetical protein HAX54_037689, partial [Datura stramonium]|nr:hypothetical protein [Datura stramonium]
MAIKKPRGLMSRKYYLTPSDDDPPEAPEDSMHDAIDNDNETGDDLFGEIDKATTLKRKEEFVKQRHLKPNPKKSTLVDAELEGIDELEPEQVVDLEEINELTGLTEISK